MFVLLLERKGPYGRTYQKFIKSDSREQFFHYVKLHYEAGTFDKFEIVGFVVGECHDLGLDRVADSAGGH